MPDMFRLAYSASMKADVTDTAEVMLYGEIINDNYRYCETDKSAALFDKEIKELKGKGATKLLLRINSPGGECTEAVAMRSIICAADFEEVNIRIEGLCASAATDLATIPNAHVAITEGSEYMIHNPWTLAFGNANDMEKTIARLRNIEQMSRGFYCAKTGQSDDQIKEWMDAETWFTAEQAVEYGFADEILKQESTKEAPIAACVGSREMAIMKSLYRSVPEQIAEIKESVTAKEEEPSENIINPKEDTEMELDNLTIDQLSEANPALLAQIQQNAVSAERNRLDEIDALTMPGYEDIAAKAKADGTSAIDFQKQIVAAMKNKGADFLAQRAAETAPAQQVAGSEPQDSVNEEEEIKAFAKSIADYAKGVRNEFGDNNMF